MKSIKKKNTGFTLIEVMIVVSIIGILAAIAVPSYAGYVERTNRKAAIAELFVIKNNLERHYSANNGSYAGFAYTANPQIKGYAIPAPTISSNGQSYTLEATLGSGGDSKCGNITVDSTGSQTSSAGSGCFR